MHIQFFFLCVSSEKLFQIFQSQLDWISISHFFSCSQQLTQELIYMLCWNGQRIKIAVDNDDKHANLMRLMFFFLSILAHVKCVEISFARRTKKKYLFSLDKYIHFGWRLSTTYMNKWWLFFQFFSFCGDYQKKNFCRLQTNTLNLLYFVKTVCCSCHTTWHFSFQNFFFAPLLQKVLCIEFCKGLVERNRKKIAQKNYWMEKMWHIA